MHQCYFEEDKIILIIHIIVSYDQNISLIFYVKDGCVMACQASTSILCLHYRPVTVHCGIKDAYTSEITFLALNPWLYTGSLRIFCFLNICILQYVYSLSYVCEIKIRMLRIYLLKFLPINDLNLFNIFKLKR